MYKMGGIMYFPQGRDEAEIFLLSEEALVGKALALD